MATLKVWIAQQERDSSCYNLISTTKKNLLEQLDARWDKDDFDTIVHVEIYYANAFDLFDLCTGESGHRDSGIGKVIKTINLK